MSDRLSLVSAVPRQILTIGVGGENFALDAAVVREILDIIPITDVPNAKPFVPGLINVRGKVVPLADLRRKLMLPELARTIDSRIVVIEIPINGENSLVGLLADKVHEVADVLNVVTEQAPRIGSRWRPEFVRAIVEHNGQFVAIIDIERIFAETGAITLTDGTPERSRHSGENRHV